MVKITAALVAALASTAAASAHRHVGRRHMHPRNYPVNTPPVADSSSAGYPVNTPPAPSSSEHVPVYPTGPAPSESSTIETHPVPSSSSHEVPVYPTGPVPSESSTHVPEHPTYPVPSKSSSIETHPVPSSSSTHEVPVYPTHPVPSSSSVETHPVPSESSTHVPVYPTHPVPSNTETHPVPSNTETHPVPSNSEVPSYPVHPVPSASEHPAPSYPVGESSHAPAPSAPVGEHEDVCEPVIVTVTAGQGPYPIHPVPSSSSVETHPVPSSSSVETHPVPSSSAVETYPVHTPPVASSSEAAPSYPASSAPAPSHSAPASSGPSGPPAGGKRGLIYQEQSNLEGYKNLDTISWAWNWNSNDFGQNAPWEYVPILNNRDQYSTFESQASAAIQSLGGNAFIMGPNEPDQDAAGGGAAMPNVQDAVDAYKTYIAPFAGQARLGSISVTSDQTPGNNKGLEYLRSWKQMCDASGDNACPVDFVCLHWYGPTNGESGAEQAQLFIDYMDSAISEVKEMFGQDMPVWVTEFGAEPPLKDDAEALIHGPFMEQVLPYLDSNPAVERYSYFMASPEYMVKADGSLTPGGQAYCN